MNVSEKEKLISSINSWSSLLARRSARAGACRAALEAAVPTVLGILVLSAPTLRTPVLAAVCLIGALLSIVSVVLQQLGFCAMPTASRLLSAQAALLVGRVERQDTFREEQRLVEVVTALDERAGSGLYRSWRRSRARAVSVIEV